MIAFFSTFDRSFLPLTHCRKLLFLAWLSLLLNACTSVGTIQPTPTTPKPKDEHAWETHQAKLNRIKNWQVTGKIAVRTSKDAGSANVDWKEANGRYVVALTGPLGAGAMTLKGMPGKVTLYMANGKQYSASNAEQLLAQNWGFTVPISNIKYWIKGLPVPGQPSQPRFDLNNRLATLRQGGVSIQYGDYTRVGGYDLPQRLTISSANLKTKIAIYHWKL